MTPSITLGNIVNFEKGKKKDKLIVSILNENNEVVKEVVLKHAIIDNIEFLKEEHLLPYLKTMNNRVKNVFPNEDKVYCFNYETGHGQVQLKVYYEKIEEKELILN